MGTVKQHQSEKVSACDKYVRGDIGFFQVSATRMTTGWTFKVVQPRWTDDIHSKERKHIFHCPSDPALLLLCNPGYAPSSSPDSSSRDNQNANMHDKASVDEMLHYYL